MDAIPTLKVIANCAVGVNNIDLAAANERGIPVGNTPDVLTDATADLAFALLLSSARHVVDGAAYVKNGQWKTWGPMLLLGRPVWGATLGVVGYGRIGRAMAMRGKGFGMKVLVASEHLTNSEAIQDGVEKASLEEVLETCDFVSLHTPLTPKTHHLIGAVQLALMKPTATIINTARGEIIDPDALTAALIAGRPAFAAVDVTEPEPIPANHPLLGLPNCLIIPHLGSATLTTRRAMTDRAMANILAGLNGEPLPYRVNP
jgi:lactate dehydrogenase-like 2-hydroxyacid dehydrogenase